MAPFLLILPVLLLAFSLFVLPAHASSAFTVQAVCLYNQSSGAASYTTLSAGSYRAYAGWVGGYVITIPASSQSGYLVVAGVFPIRATGTYSSWYTPTSYYIVPNSQYYLSSSGSGPIPHRFTNTDEPLREQNGPFDGVIYVPAHSSPLYLYVLSAYDATKSNYGAYQLSNAFISFVPDSSGASDLSSLLQQQLQQLQAINTNMQNIYNELLSSSGSSQGQLQQLQDINNNIQNIFNEVTNNTYLSDSEELRDEVSEIAQQIDDMADQLRELVARPPAEDIVPSIGDMLKPSDEASQVGLDMVGGIFSNRLIMALMTMVLTFSIIRYILYGKVGK